MRQRLEPDQLKRRFCDSTRAPGDAGRRRRPGSPCPARRPKGEERKGDRDPRGPWAAPPSPHQKRGAWRL
eukprot:7195354-Pyramimonas_sp.AAC.1